MPADPRDILLLLLARLPDAAVAELVALAEAMRVLIDREEALRGTPTPVFPTTRTRPPGQSSQ